MTHAPETGAINRLHFSGVGFWYVCHANLGPDSYDTRFRRRLEHSSTPSQKVACAWFIHFYRAMLAQSAVMRLLSSVRLSVCPSVYSV